MRYAIAIDVGITSVGYVVLVLDSNDMPCRIIRLGSRIFDLAENPKDGSSLAKPRREARGMRRRLRRKRHRKERIRGIIVSSGLLTADALNKLYSEAVSDIYTLRVDALDRLLTNEEFARVLIHLSQRRGFKSNRKSAAANSADGALLAAVSANKALMAEKGYRTVGEMLLNDEKYSVYKRNKSASYIGTVSRDDIADEVKQIFAAQRKFGNAYAGEDFEAKYTDIMFSQRSFAEGPACGPYSGNQVDKMRGKCTFEEGEPRAARASYSFQIFSLWQKINHIRIYNGTDARALTDDERHILFIKAHEKPELKYSAIRKLLKLAEGDVFAGLQYNKDKNPENAVAIKELSRYHTVKNALSVIKPDYINTLDADKLDAIGEAFSKELSDDGIIAELQRANVPQEAYRALLDMGDFSKFGHLSVKACKKIIPYLERGMTYDKACTEAGYNFKADEKDARFTLPSLVEVGEEIKNPVVLRAVSQTIKVINAIIREQKASPVYINIELARELALTKEERDMITKAQKENFELNENALKQLKEQIKEFSSGVEPKGQDIIKYRLWQQQDGVCPYSQEKIELSRLLEPGYVDVDHIAPYSKTFDDRMSNKVLVMARENRQKGNRLPLEYLDGDKRDRFIVWVNSCDSIPASKKRRLLTEKISDEKGWKERNLVDTQYISSFLGKYINTYLEFAPFVTGKKRHVMCVNGAITAYVRKRWGIQKIREDGDLHHAVDAAVIGCITQGMIQRITNYSKYDECKFNNGEYVVDDETGEVISDMSHFPFPWDTFRDELTIRLNPDRNAMIKALNDMHPANYDGIDLNTVPSPFVSRMCNMKATGAAHKQTAMSGREYKNGCVVYKADLKKLKLDKNGEIQNYYNPESDRLLYDALKKRLTEFGGNAEKAFADEFHKPSADGKYCPIVKKVKLIEASSSAVEIHNRTAIADNDSMVRCDVFYVEGDGYYFVPIYIADTVKKELPSLAPTRKVDKNGRRIYAQMCDDNFVFSLYKNSLIKVYNDKDIEMSACHSGGSLPKSIKYNGRDGVYIYYRKLNVCTAVFVGITHDNTYQKDSFGKTLTKIEKYEVDVLGNISKVNKEKRQKF